MKGIRLDTAIYGLSQVLERALSFLLLPILTKGISPAEYAIWSQAVVVSGLMIPILMLGFPNAIIKLTPKWATEPTVGRSILCAIFVTIILLLVVLLFVFIIFDKEVARLAFDQSVSVPYVPLLFTIILSEVLFDCAVSYLRACGLITRISVYMLIRGLARVAVLFVVLNLLNKGFLFAFISLTLLQLLFILFVVQQDLPWKSIAASGLSPGRLHWAEVIAASLPLVPLSLLISANNSFGRFLLLHSYDLTVVAIYSAAYSLTAIPAALYSVIGFTLFPELSRRWNNSTHSQVQSLIGNSLLFYSFLTLPFLAIMAVFGADILQLLTTPEYQISNSVMLLLTASVCLFGVYQLSFYILLLGHSIKSGLWLTLFATAVNGALSIWLIPSFGTLGAAIAIFVSNAVLALTTLYLAGKIVPWRIDSVLLLRVAGKVFLFFISLLVFSTFFSNRGWLEVLISLGVSGLLYVCLDVFDRKRSILRVALKW